MSDRRILIEAANRTVAIERGVVVEPVGPFDLVLRIRGEVRPGLINAHDHLHRNHYGRLGDPPYADSSEWGEDIHRLHRDEIATGKAVPRREALLRGAWKNLLAGVTTVVHHDAWEADFEVDFPIRVAKVPAARSLGNTPDRDGIFAGRSWCVHLAEGTNGHAAREVDELQARSLLDRHVIAVHGLGMDACAIAKFRASGAALVWCPSSNLFLFGRTAPAELLAEGIDVMLGSDSLLSGDGNLLDELRLARRLGLLSDRRLEDAVGVTAARRLGLAEPTLEPGAQADLVVLSKPLLEAGAGNVELVMVGGTPRVASSEVATQLEGVAGRAVTVLRDSRRAPSRQREPVFAWA